MHPGTEHSNGAGGAIVYVKKRDEAQDNLEKRGGGAQDVLKLLVLLEITYSESIDNT